MASVLAGCLLTKVGPPLGAAPLRYRDPLFSDVTITHDLAYGSAPDRNDQPLALKLDLYEPSGDTVAQRPAVVQVHGGGFIRGDKSSEGYMVEPLAKRGFVAVAINYRLLAPAGCFGSVDLSAACTAAAEAAIHDAQAAVRWLRANAATYRIDPNRIAIEGFSAGGIVATGVGVMSDQVGDSGNPGYSSKVGGWLSASGGLPDGSFVDSSDSPGYLMSGDADTLVPYQWSVDTAKALSDAGQLAVLFTEKGVDHQLPDLTVLATQSASFYYLVLHLATAQR